MVATDSSSSSLLEHCLRSSFVLLLHSILHSILFYSLPGAGPGSPRSGIFLGSAQARAHSAGHGTGVR